MDDFGYEVFNKASPSERAAMIIKAGQKARGLAPAPSRQRREPVPEEGDKTAILAAAIIRAGRIRRGEAA
jgi:hypothetical protein